MSDRSAEARRKVEGLPTAREEQIMRLASAENPRSRRHDERTADRRQMWRCIPIEDIVGIRNAIIDSLAPTGEHVHEGQWCHPCVQHGSDAMLAGIAEAQAVHDSLAPVGLDVERLADAIVAAVRAERAPIGYKGDGWPAYWEKDRPATVLAVSSLAKRLAAEYARLTAESGEPG